MKPNNDLAPVVKLDPNPFTDPFTDFTPLDADGYPTAEALRGISVWTGTPRELVDDVLVPLFRAYGTVEVTDALLSWGPRVKRVRLSTGGWSGNEDAINALKDGFFWFAWWTTTRRGGHYTFDVPEDRWDSHMVDWTATVELRARLLDPHARVRSMLARAVFASAEVVVPDDAARLDVEVSLPGTGEQVAVTAVAYDATGEPLATATTYDAAAVNALTDALHG